MKMVSRIKRVLITAILFTPAFMIAGELAQPETDGSIISETLQVQTREMMAEIYAGMKTERRLPPDISSDEIKKRTDTNVEWLKKLKIFNVSVQQEQSFKK